MNISMLLQLNPWAEPFQSDFSSDEFAAARAKASKTRLNSGEDALRAWSSAMKALQPHAKRDADLFEAWLALSCIDLHDWTFSRSLDLVGCHFPGELRLRQLTISSDFYLDACDISGPLLMEDVTIAGSASFQTLKCRDKSELRRVTFNRRVDFTSLNAQDAFTIADSLFKKDAWFREAVFQGPLTIEGNVFESDAGFHYAHFSGPASFAGTQFKDSCGVEKARFDGPIDLQNVRVARKLWTQGASFARLEDANAFEALRPQEGAPSSPTGPRLVVSNDTVRKKGA